MTQETHDIYFVTGNQQKFNYLSSQMPMPQGTRLVMQKISTIEIQSASIREIALNKAQQAYQAVKKPVIVHDAGMNVPALNGYPGAYLKDFVTTISQEMLHKIFATCDDRSMIYEDYMIYIDESGHVTEFSHDSADILILSDRIGTKYLASHPMDNLSSFRFAPEKTLSEYDDIANFYNKTLLEAGIVPCWTQFARFMMQKTEK